MSRFVHINPGPDASWRAVILFGRNSAAYKFALGEALLELARQGRTAATLEELAAPYARAVCRHLADADRQGTATGIRFLDACRRHTRGELPFADLLETTRTLGFVNVLDAFHRVGEAEVGTRFFDVRDRGAGLAITDELLALAASPHGPNLPGEVEARWRLVETAWNVGVAAPLLEVVPDAAIERLVVQVAGRSRVGVTSARDALNGYQRGACFYCAASVSIVPGAASFADVDHVYPVRLAGWFPDLNLNGVWNLVLACGACNRGARGKLDRLPHLDYLERLSRRNDYLINSHHPLRETLVRQTGVSGPARRAFLQDVDRRAVAALGTSEASRWRAPHAVPESF